MDFGGLVVVQCGRVPAVGRTAELAADSSGTAAEKRDVEGSKGVYVARAAISAAWDAARSVFLVRVRVRIKVRIRFRVRARVRVRVRVRVSVRIRVRVSAIGCLPGCTRQHSYWRASRCTQETAARTGRRRSWRSGRSWGAYYPCTYEGLGF